LPLCFISFISSDTLQGRYRKLLASLQLDLFGLLTLDPTKSTEKGLSRSEA